MVAPYTSPKPRSADRMATTTIKVDGMTCAACTSAVEAAFSGIDGAGDVSVSLMLGRVVLRHDQIILPPEKVTQLIEDRGFDATILSTEPSPSAFNSTGSSDVQQGSRPLTAATTLAIEGMTCGACTSAVEGGLTNVSGVRAVNVSLLSERAVVEHDASEVTPDQLVEAVEDRGFGARALETNEHRNNPWEDDTNTDGRPPAMVTTVSIEGMTCGACTSSVQNAFKDADGLIQFNISLLAERAIVVHDPSVLTTQKITSLIEGAGFDASIISSQSRVSSSQPLQHVKLSLYGVRDAASAAALEDALLQKPGVTVASVELAIPQLSVTYNSAITGIRSVVEAIEAEGYNALLTDSNDNNAQLESLSKTKEVQEWKRAFLFSASFAVPVFIINMILPMHAPALDFGKIALFPGIYLGDLVCLALTIPVQFGIGKRFYITSFRSLKHRAPTMDVLVMLGTSAAFFYSVFTMIMTFLFYVPGARPSTVFDTSTMLITFITLGRWMENRAKGQTSAALSRLMCLAPSMATIYDDPIAAEKAVEESLNGQQTSDSKGPVSPDHGRFTGQKAIPTELIQVGDIVVLRPGDKVSADGVVIRGESYLDESMITGEAVPIRKTKGSLVIAGTVNGTGAIDFKVTRVGKDTQLSQIVKLVQDAQTSRAPIQRMADVVAGYFVPTIISLGLVTFFGWMFISHVLPHPPQIFLAEQSGGRVMVCLKLCISVIVFACPCALGLSTPTAVMVGTGVGAENGILVKGGAVLEAATRITHVIFDKTGTLTSGKLSVADVQIEPTWTTNEWRRRLWWLIVGLAEMNSEHPIGRAILATARIESGHPGDGELPGSISEFEACVGQGISATVEPASSIENMRYRVLVGNAKFLRSRDIQVPESVEPDPQEPERASVDSIPAPKPSASAGLSRIHMAFDNRYAGTVSLRDTVKPTALAAVAALHHMGISTSIITGDSYTAASSIAQAVGIPSTEIHASVSPSDKQSIISSQQSTGDIVAMVGDGINDSPALATSNVGIALVSGTDVAVEAADIVLMRSDDLLSVPASLSLSRSVFNRIKLNLLWACLYNVIGLPFAMGLLLPFCGFVLPPMASGAAMAASSISVVVSSLLLKFWKRPRWMNPARLEKEAQLGNIAIPASSAARKDWGRMSRVSFVFGKVRNVLAALWFSVTGRRASSVGASDGYIPLRTVEPAVA